MKCPKCGTDIPIDDIRDEFNCHSCGVKLVCNVNTILGVSLFIGSFLILLVLIIFKGEPITLIIDVGITIGVFYIIYKYLLRCKIKESSQNK